MSLRAGALGAMRFDLTTSEGSGNLRATEGTRGGVLAVELNCSGLRTGTNGCPGCRVVFREEEAYNALCHSLHSP